MLHSIILLLACASLTFLLLPVSLVIFFVISFVGFAMLFQQHACLIVVPTLLAFTFIALPASLLLLFLLTLASACLMTREAVGY